ncbi:hypothetical protein [Gilliamella sp. ESL0254]|uniref:hypothetical protein n=1 Tax=Gilliamella sp. ESL0254 TaxID=2705035 RepID=UPI001580E34D|nr:hypothetical protein [Gilliamella sp. ESL0254]NUF26539.1 hypothetical protein [Gilliamella sp. ESL0254]
MLITWICRGSRFTSMDGNPKSCARIILLLFIFILAFVPLTYCFAQERSYRNKGDHLLFTPKVGDIYLFNLANVGRNGNDDSNDFIYDLYQEKIIKIDDSDIDNFNTDKIGRYQDLYVGMKLLSYNSSNYVYTVALSNVAYTSLSQAKSNLILSSSYSNQHNSLDDREMADLRQNDIMTDVIRRSLGKSSKKDPYYSVFMPMKHDVYLIDLAKFNTFNYKYSNEFNQDDIYQQNLTNIDGVSTDDFNKDAKNKSKKIYVGMKMDFYSLRNDYYQFAVSNSGYTSLKEAKIKLPSFDYNLFDLTISGKAVRYMINHGIIVDKVRESEYLSKEENDNKK